MTKLILAFFSFFFFALPLLAQAVDTAWVRRYNGPVNGGENARAIAIDDSNNVCVTGYSPGRGTSADYATIKYYPDGDTAWVRRYNGPKNFYDAARAIAIDSHGNICVTGYSPGIGTFDDYATIKYDPEGKQLWVRRYNGPTNDNDRAYAIAVDNLDNLYVTGVSGPYPNQDYTTIKYDKKGKQLWIRRYNGPGDGNDEARAITVDGSGNIYVSGVSTGSGTSSDCATVKYDKKGNELWVRRYNGSKKGYDEATALAVDFSGNVCVTGGSETIGTDRDYFTIKYYPDGDTAWVRKYNGPANGYDQARAIATDSYGNIYVTGESFGNKTGWDYATVKYYPDGDKAWVKRYNGPGNGNDYARAIALDGSGNIYVTGYSLGKGTAHDYATIKYYPNGETAWVKRYNGPGNKADLANAIALDGFNNVYVTGRSHGRGSAYDYATIKYGQVQSRNDTLIIFAYSSVDLAVKDPKGDLIGIDFNTISHASYDTTLDINGDGASDDRIVIPNPLEGDYAIRVTAETGTGNEHYTLAVKRGEGEEQFLVILSPVPEPGQADTVFYKLSD